MFSTKGGNPAKMSINDAEDEEEESRYFKGGYEAARHDEEDV